MTGTRKLSIEVVGDTRGVSRAFGEVETSSGKMSSVVSGAGLALGAGIAVGAGMAVRAIGDWTAAAAADDSAQILFESQLKMAGASDQVVESMNEQISAGQRLKGFNDNELRNSYVTAFNSSGDMVKANEDVALAMDIARKAGVPLETAMKAVTKANEGQATALKKLLPEYGSLIDGAGSSAEALEIVRGKTAGLADEFANTSEGKTARMKESLGELTETIGGFLIPAMQAVIPVVQQVADFLGTRLPSALRTAGEFISENREYFIALGVGLAAVALAIGVTLVPAFVAWTVAAGAAAVATLAAAAPFIAIGVAVAALVAGVIYAYQNFDVFRNAVNKVRDFITGSLVPAFQQLWQFISNNIVPILQQVAEVYLALLVRWFGILRATLMDVVIPAMQAVWSFVRDRVIPVLVSIAGTIAEVASDVGGKISEIVGFVTGIPGRISATVSGLFRGIETGITAAKDWVSEKIDDVVGFATGLKGRMSGIFSGMWDGIKSAFGSVINSVIGVWNRLEFKVPGVSAFGQTIGGFTIGVPDIAPVRFHSGGQVGGMSFAGMGNDEVAAVLQKGENVLTAGQTSALAGSGGNTYNICLLYTSPSPRD